MRIALLLLSAALSRAGEPVLSVEDLGTLGGRHSWALDIDESGRAAGGAQRKDGVERAFVWEAGKMTELGEPAVRSRSARRARPSRALALGGPGEAAGVYWRLHDSDAAEEKLLSMAGSVGLHPRALVWTKNGVLELSKAVGLPFFHVFDMDGAGRLVGPIDADSIRSGSLHKWGHLDGPEHIRRFVENLKKNKTIEIGGRGFFSGRIRVDGWVEPDWLAQWLGRIGMTMLVENSACLLDIRKRTFVSPPFRPRFSVALAIEGSRVAGMRLDMPWEAYDPQFGDRPRWWFRDRWRGLIWDPEKKFEDEVKPLPGFGEVRVVALDRGESAVGVMTRVGQARAFLRRHPETRDLGVPPGYLSSVASALGGGGLVVGYASNAGMIPQKAVAWSGGKVLSLEELAAPSVFRELRAAFAINDKGQIVGYGVREDGSVGAFRATPLKGPEMLAQAVSVRGEVPEATLHPVPEREPGLPSVCPAEGQPRRPDEFMRATTATRRAQSGAYLRVRDLCDCAVEAMARKKSGLVPARRPMNAAQLSLDGVRLGMDKAQATAAYGKLRPYPGREDLLARDCEVNLSDGKPSGNYHARVFFDSAGKAVVVYSNYPILRQEGRAILRIGADEKRIRAVLGTPRSAMLPRWAQVPGWEGGGRDASWWEYPELGLTLELDRGMLRGAWLTR